MGIEMVCIKNKLLHSSPPKSIDMDDIPCLILWTNVKECLPENKTKCLIWTKIHFVPDHCDDKNYFYGYEISTYYTNHGFVSNNGIFAEYWMPLPKPPKGVNIK